MTNGSSDGVTPSTNRLESPNSTQRPTLANWIQPPGNRWAFRHVRELIPSARVAARHARALPESLVEGLVCPDDETLLEASFTDALVVLRDGELVHEAYAEGVHPDDRHILFSVTKSVTGLVVGCLLSRGLLSLNDAVGDLVPDINGSAFETATLRDLLDMSVAVRFTEDYDGLDMRRYREAAGLLPDRGRAGLHRLLKELVLDGAHGQGFQYASPVTDMLGWVCESVTDRHFADLVSELIWTPMGAEHDADLLVDAFGAPRTGGGLNVTARDMARIGQFVLDGAGEVSRDFLDDLLTAGSSDFWAKGIMADLLPGGAYRSCWYQPRQDRGVVMGLGIHGQWLYVDTARRVVVAKQSSGPEATSPNDPRVVHMLRQIASRAAAA